MTDDVTPVMKGSSHKPHRVVVTGRGLVTPLGRTAETLVDRWTRGDCAAAPITRLDVANLPVRIGCEVPDFEVRQEIRNRKLTRLLHLSECFGFVAAGGALADAGLADGDYDPSRAGIVAGIRKEGFRDANFYDAIQAALQDDGSIDRERFIEDGIRRVPPQTIVEGLANAGIYHIAHEHRLQGFNQNFLGIGAGGFLAIGEALGAVRNNEADFILAGSFDSWLTWAGLRFSHYVGFAAASTDASQHVSRPFSLNRQGSVVGEGAALLVMESLGNAQARKAPIYGEIRGFGASTGVPSSNPTACAGALAASIRRALEVAELTPEEIDLIHLNGDATVEGDAVEARAVNEALGERANKIPATTLKSATGYLSNASSSTEVVAVLEVLRRGVIPPIVNLKTPDPALNLHLIRDPLSGNELRHALLIGRSWPSQYVALVVSRGDELI